MWKAVLILFMTSNTEPMSMMVGQFPEAFVSEAECQKFVTGTRGEIDQSVEVLTDKGEKKDYSVLHHELSCVVDESGDPA